MAVSKAQQKAVAKYMKSNYDELKVRVPKGRKEIIKSIAEQQGKSLNSFIIEAIDEKINGSEKSEDLPIINNGIDS